MAEFVMKERIKDFFVAAFGIEFDGNVNLSTDLKLAKIIDSFNYIEIVLFLREELGVEATPDDLADGRLDSVEAIAAMVEDKRVAAPA